MNFDQRKHDEKPLSRGEKWTVGVLSLAFLGMMAMEILSNYEPRRLAAVFFVIWWMPLLVIHEFGHAVMAKFLGWQVDKIQIGFGHKILQLTWRGVPVELRMIPLEGFVRCQPKKGEYSPLKDALIYFAGPGVELLIFSLIGLYLGAEGLFSIGDDYSMLALQSFAFAALAGAIINLIPMSIETESGSTPNDGMGVLQCLGMYFRR